MGWTTWHSTIPRSIVADQIAYRHEVDEQAISVRPILHPCRDFVSRLSPFRTLGILRLAHGDLGFAVPRQGSVLRLINQYSSIEAAGEHPASDRSGRDAHRADRSCSITTPSATVPAGPAGGYTVFDVSVRRPWRLSRYPRRTYRQGEDGMDSRRCA